MGCGGSKATDVATCDQTEEEHCPILYVNHISPVCRACVMITCELNINVTIKEVDILAGEQHEDWFAEINPNCTVPALVHGDVTLTASVDIAHYLVTTFSKGCTLYPDDEEETCKIDQIIEYCQTELFPHVKEIVKDKYEERQTAEETIVVIQASFVHISAELGDNDYLCGDYLTIADLFAFSMFANVLLDPCFQKPDGIDALNAWGQRIRALPYFANTHAHYFSVKKQFSVQITGQAPPPEECPEPEPEECPVAEPEPECPAEPECPTLWIDWSSAACRSVMMVTAELDITINVKEISIANGDHQCDDYLAINPNGTVPTLVDGETIIVESTEISIHLVAKYAHGHALYPDTCEIKEKIDALLAYERQYIYPILGRLIRPLIEGCEPAGEEVHAEMHATMVHVNGTMSDEGFLVSASVTVVDIAIYNDFKQASIDPGFAVPDECECVKSWMAKMEELSCAQTHEAQFVAVKQTVVVASG